MSPTIRTSRRGLTLLELMLALTITIFIGGGLASVLTMISQVTAFDRDARTGALRAHAAQVRLQAYTETGRCVLQVKDGDFALWLDDANSSDTVNLLELRVFWVGADGELTVERVDPPDSWTPEQIEAYDVELLSSANFFNIMRLERKAGMTTTAAILDGLTAASIDHDAASVQDAARLRYAFTQSFPSGAESEAVIALALPNHAVPEI